jgi:formyl-CoA transferase/CoA:oxalate CoA-transferase
LRKIDPEDDLMSKPLEGIRVLDLTRHMTGPYCTVFLSDYGADVIKVESVPHGDPSRRTGTAFIGDESGLFLIWNRGKRSIALDLRKPEGVEIAHRLAKTCDVVIENYRPGVADKIGLGYEELSALNDRLVYVSISAFGSSGPWAPDPGTDPVVQAMSGVMSVTGEADGEPLYVGVPIADFTAAMIGVQATLLGLMSRERTGRGQKVELSMLYALMTSLTTRLASYWFGDEVPTRHGNEHSVVAPYQAFETADGHAVAGVWGAGEAWPRFCEAIDRMDLVDDPRFVTNVERVANRVELKRILGEIFIQKTTAEWRQRFHAARALFGPVMDIPGALVQDQVAHGEFVTTVDHPTLGPIPQLRPVIELSDTPGEISRHPPLLGEHSIEVLQELGYDEDEIVQIVADETVLVHALDEAIAKAALPDTAVGPV